MKYRRPAALALAAALPLIALATCKDPDETDKGAGPAPANSALSSLAVSEGTLEPAFSREVSSYSLVVPNAVRSITVTPAVRDKSARIEVNGAPCASGTPSAPIPLAVGENRVTVAARESRCEIVAVRLGESPRLTLEFTYGADGTSSYKNIYVAWIEDLSGNVIQHLAVCNRLVGVGGPLTNTALPFWKTKRYDADKVAADAVTGATKARQNFAVTAVLKDPTVTAFKVCFETDRSYDPNGWFTDQPALLYSATVDLAAPKRRYDLAIEAWTVNEGTMSSLKQWLGTLSVGSAQRELRFVTNAKDPKSTDAPPFGGPAPDESATRFVGGIALTVE